MPPLWGMGELMNIFKPYTLAELLARPDETAEQAYRRAYRDGYVAALQAAYRSRDIPKKLWDFWQDTLLEWGKHDTDRMVPPPGCP
jgi:hypothetical protein